MAIGSYINRKSYFFFLFWDKHHDVYVFKMSEDLMKDVMSPIDKSLFVSWH